MQELALSEGYRLLEPGPVVMFIRRRRKGVQIEFAQALAALRQLGELSEQLSQ